MLETTLNVRVPNSLLKLGLTQEEIQRHVSEWLVFSLFSDGKISSGKAGKLLGISRLDFIKLRVIGNRRDKPFFVHGFHGKHGKVQILKVFPCRPCYPCTRITACTRDPKLLQTRGIAFINFTEDELGEELDAVKKLAPKREK